MEVEELSVTDEEKDVGVYVNTTLKPGNHWKKTSKKAAPRATDH
jgi:hypothetical protein